ncbi:MAG: hypothetical protein IJE67_02975 [Peptococcaceae bacterium]|nr:hypothetical protein [Peptococcaceae bacterium]
MKQSNTFKRLGTGVVLTAFLVCCFFGATFTLRPAYADWTQAPTPCLNGGNPVITQDMYTIEPGMTIREDFTILNINDENKPVYYGFYFDNLNEYAKVLEVSILEKVSETEYRELTKGVMGLMGKDSLKKAGYNDVADVLQAGAPKTLYLQIHYPEEAGNAAMGKTFDFDFWLVFSKDEVPASPVNNEG